MPDKECLHTAALEAQLAIDLDTSLARLESAGAVLVADEDERRTYGCGAVDGCTYECAMVIAGTHPVRSVAAAGVCQLALRDMADGGSSTPEI